MVIMETLSVVLSSFPPIQNQPKLKSTASNHHLRGTHFPFPKNSSLRTLLKTSLSLTSIHPFTSLPSVASETLISQTEHASDKISLESILVSVDDFFNRNPFFVAGCTVIWLVVIPLTREYFRKYKFIPAIEAFRKLRDDSGAQVLDIRDKKSVMALGSPNLKIFNKNVVQVEFPEDDEDGFVKNVLEKFQDPANTVLCILDNFDGNSMRVAGLLYKNGFKEAYAIRGGVRGKKGWLAIQEMLLPPSVHMNRTKKKKKKQKAEISQVGINGGVGQQNEDQKDTYSSVDLPIEERQRVDNGHVNRSMNSPLDMKIGSRSPYYKYPDLKPPSSPTPSKP